VGERSPVDRGIREPAYDARMRGWTDTDVPDQHRRTVVVTGANSGLGLETARILAARGGRVVLACRRRDAAEEAADDIRSSTAEADLEVADLDLSDLASVRRFTEPRGDRVIDVLINNAGVMALPRGNTADGFERHLGINHLGHFALTAGLLPNLLRSPAPRVVTVTSDMHRFGRIRFDDLMGERRYGPWRAYAQSKLANVLFARELARRAESAGLPLSSLLAHPGYSATELQQRARSESGRPPARFWLWANRHFAQPAGAGAWPTLRAATDPTAPNGGLYGPRGPLGGPATAGTPARRSRDLDAARRLWKISERLTGVIFAL